MLYAKNNSSCTIVITQWAVQTLFLVSSWMLSYLFAELDALVLFHLLMDSRGIVCGMYKSPFLQSQACSLTDPLASWLLPLPSKEYSCRLRGNTLGAHGDMLGLHGDMLGSIGVHQYR